MFSHSRSYLLRTCTVTKQPASHRITSLTWYGPLLVITLAICISVYQWYLKLMRHHLQKNPFADRMRKCLLTVQLLCGFSGSHKQLHGLLIDLNSNVIEFPAYLSLVFVICTLLWISCVPFSYYPCFCNLISPPYD